MINVGIIGGAGYTGGELIRLLINHPQVHISFIHSRSNAGKYVYEVHKDLIGDTKLKFSNSLSFGEGGGEAQDIDCLFLCLGHGESTRFLQENKIADAVKIIDLANDFRLKKDSVQEAIGRTFVYGLPELNKEAIIAAHNIANPGCFATTIQSGLLPLAKAGLLKDIYTTGITGSTGAGQSLSATSHFSWRASNIQAYKTLTHQHLGEIGESLHQLQPDTDIELSFVPWRGDFTRGIFVSSTIATDLSLEELFPLFEAFYEDHPFTQVSRTPVFLKQVVNTNKAVVHLEKAGNKLVVHSALDNLLKGASGQAVHNMNLVFGLEETLGLRLKPSAF
ncbi:MAG TPA: N-acetyl-gamma-glutamyl-phosphate reductase [Niabella sp.]|nr:N-acetyl-gamma-glutamyl-phosphate reductase [Niabella sp.]